MDSIFNNLRDPGWWFTAFFPAVAVILAPKVWRFTTSKLRDVSRRSKAKALNRVRGLRRDDLLITSEMMSAQSAFAVFMLFVGVGLILLVLNPFAAQPKANVGFVLVISIPIFVSEVVWLVKDVRVQEVLKYRRRWTSGRPKAKQLPQ